MTIEYIRYIFEGVVVDGDGDITIKTSGSYHGEEVEREFSIQDMHIIIDRANAHHGAYQAYKDRGFEDEDQYYTDYNFITSYPPYN